MDPRFALRTLRYGQHQLDITCFSNPDREFDAHFDEEQAEAPEPPLYGCLWPSAEALAQALWESPDCPSPVLEIGCGLGLPSLICALRGAEVSAFDHHPEALPLLEANAARNGLHLTHAFVGSFSDPELNLGRFPLILGSDILYEPDLYPALEAFLERHIAPKGRIIIADPGRFAVARFGQKLRARAQYSQRSVKLAHHKYPLELHEYKFLD